jgi:hypothetical protein
MVRIMVGKEKEMWKENRKRNKNAQPEWLGIFG